MLNTEIVYESRYGWTRRTVTLLIVCLLFTAGVLLLDPNGHARFIGIPIPMPVIQVAGIALFGGGGLLMAFNAATRKVGLRVDANGILLGGSPLRYAATTAFVPWSEVTGVELWIQYVRAGYRTNRIPYVGVHRTPGSPALPGNGAGLGMGAALAKVPRALLNGSRPVSGWPLDTARLLEAVRHHAPGIDIVVSPDYPDKH